MIEMIKALMLVCEKHTLTLCFYFIPILPTFCTRNVFNNHTELSTVNCLIQMLNK